MAARPFVLEKEACDPRGKDSDKDAEKKPGVSRRWKWGAVLGLILASQQLTLSRAWGALARVSSCAQKESIKPTKMLLSARHWGSAGKNNQGSSLRGTARAKVR